MGEFRANPNIRNRIFLAGQTHSAPFLTDSLYGDALLNTTTFNARAPTIVGTRNGTPHGQPPEYFAQRNFQANPYVRGMHPSTSNMMVDIAPSVYNTNPMAGMGGYKANLASLNGTRPLATALDEPKELIERLYEDKFRLSPSHPLGAQYSMNQKRLDKTVRGTMYDAFRSRMNDNTTDEDLVMESKIIKGYGNNPDYGKTSNDRLKKRSNHVYEKTKTHECN